MSRFYLSAAAAAAAAAAAESAGVAAVVDVYHLHSLLLKVLRIGF